jgi:hypothetical protein
MPPEEKVYAKKQIARDPESPAVRKARSVQLQAFGAILDEDDESSSKRIMGPRKRFELALPVVSMFFKKLKKKKRATAGKGAVGEDRKNDEVVSELREILSRPIVRAAEKANLDVDDQLDRQILMCMLAWSIYGGKGPGRGKMWSDNKLKQLLIDFETVRLTNPDQKEEEICKFLCSRKSNFDQYQALKPATLRRRLQDAKNLIQLDQEEARIKKVLLTSE